MLTVKGPVIDALLACGDHSDNPINACPFAYNGVVIDSLLKLPDEVFSRQHRESNMNSWPPLAFVSSQEDGGESSFQMSTLDPAVISLKVKMMRLPSIYTVGASSPFIPSIV